MAAIFEKRKKFFKLSITHFLGTLWVKHFDEIALSRTVKEIQANLCFFHFGEKFKMAAIFGEGKIVNFLDNLWVENFDEIALSRVVKEKEANLQI